MKKLYTIFLVLLLIAIGSSALAANANGQGDLIARNAELAAFMDDNGNIFVSGIGTPVNTTKASSIVAIDPYRIIFFVEPGNDITVPESRLVSLNLSDFAETIITDDAAAACIREDEVFYISKSNPTQLKKYGIDTKMTATAFSSFETMQSLYNCSDGVVISMVDNTGAYIYDSTFGNAIPYNEVIAGEIGIFDEFEVFLTDAQALMIKEAGASSSKTVDTSVKNWAVIDDTIYYICGSTGSLSLRSYNVSNALWDNIMVLPLEIDQQLTASNRSLFMISGIDHTVYTLDTAARRLKTFATLPSLTSYALGNGRTLTGYRIEAVSGQLNIYGELAAADAGVMFNFVEFAGQAVRTKQDSILLSAYSIKEEDTVWNLLQPAKQYTTLRRGSRGEAVSAIQQPLTDKGYYDYYIDGVFGWRTERAIELLQADLGLPVTGAADAELQKIILSENFGIYDPYKQLTRGDRGLRVLEMQQRLRDLGYLADDADGIYGPRTQKAVALFQDENNLRETGTADSATLRKLFSDAANVCSSYIDLQYGDSGYRVRELNNRLKKLYYLEGKVGSTYNSATRAAVIRFQQEVGLKQTGTATVAVQQKLFSKYAPEYSGYITLQRGDDNARVKALQRRLKELGYYTDSVDGYFGKNTLDAVKKFQRAVGLTANGIADPVTKREIYSSSAPHYKEPVQLGLPVIELSAYSKYENGIYQIADTDTVSGGINATWYAEGPVESFDMLLKDDRGTVYMQNYALSLDQNIISIPISTLSEERTYTLTVTANPDSTKDGAPTSASIQFIRIMEEPEPEPEEIGKIGKLIISPAGSDIVRENDVYLIPGETLTFNWSADGSVSGYIYNVTDANGTLLYSNAEADETTEFTVAASALSGDIAYTLTVYAVPTNGTIENATIESISFKPYTAPAVDPEPEVKPEVDIPVLNLDPCAQVSEREITVNGEATTVEVYEAGDMSFILTWDSGESASRYGVTILNGSGIAIMDQVTEEKYITYDASQMVQGEVYTLIITAYCAADETVTESATLYFALPQIATLDEPPVEEEQPIVEEQPEIVIGNPVISFDPCIGDAVDENGYEFALIGESESLLVSWYAEGDIAGYDVLITDANDVEMSALHTESASATLPTAYLQRDAIYTISVSAVAAADSSVTASASANFKLPAIEQEEPQEAVQEEPAGETEQPAIGDPQISFDPITEISADNIAMIADADQVTISWPAEGEIGSYLVYVLNSYGGEVAALETASESGALPMQYLERGEVYTVNVTAVSAVYAGVDSYASAQFMVPAVEQQEIPEEPEYVVEEEYAEESTEEYVEEEPVPVTIGNPQIYVNPTTSSETGANGETVWLIDNTDAIYFDWYAEGNVDGYQVQIIDETGYELTTNYLYSASSELSTEYFSENVVYTVNVTAVAAEDASVTSFATASFKLPASEPEYVEEEYVEEYVEEEYVEEEYVEEEYVEEYVEEEYVEEEYVEEYVEEEYVEEEYVPDPVTIGETLLTIEPAVSTEMDNNNDIIYYLDASGEMMFSWYAEGNIGGYEISIVDEMNNGGELIYNSVANNDMTVTADQLLGSGLAYDTMYRIYVTAIAAEDNSVTTTASAWFVLLAPEAAA